MGRISLSAEINQRLTDFLKFVKTNIDYDIYNKAKTIASDISGLIGLGDKLYYSYKAYKSAETFTSSYDGREYNKSINKDIKFYANSISSSNKV